MRGNYVARKITNSNIPDRVVVFFVLFNFILGLTIIDDYGISWDMFAEMEHGAYTLDYIAQNNPFNPQQYSMGELNYYGPAFITTAEAITRLLQSIWPELDTFIVYYGLNFVLFQLGVYFFYRLSKRFMNNWTALVTTVIFATQPIFFGHAVINVKDLPLMSMFLISIALGLDLFDRIEKAEYPKFSKVSFKDFQETLRSEWQLASICLRNRIKRFAFAITTLLVIILIFWQSLIEYLHSVIIQVYFSNGETFLGRLFHRLAENISDVPLEAYLSKATILVQRAVSFGFIVIFIIFIIFLIRKLPNSSQKLWRITLQPYLGDLDRSFPKRVLGHLLKPWVLFAGITAGLAGAVRVTGLAAWGLIIVIGVLFRKGKALAPLFAYSLATWLTTYLLWPFLWWAKLPGLIRSYKVMGRFPLSLSVLVDGEYFESTNLPTSYIFKLLPIQFTEPVVIGFLIGLIVFILLIKNNKISRGYAALLVFWFFIPVLLILIRRPTMFDNFRHMLFIMPPVLVIFGIGLNWLLKSNNQRWVSAVIGFLVIIPGAAALIRLHPYQYVYYNQFVGGVGGAYGQYEMDYWGTSYREGIEFINEASDIGASVVVWGPSNLADYFARPDLNIISSDDFSDSDSKFYILVLARFNAQNDYFPDLPSVYVVEREGAEFSIVRVSE
jgi:hypothetical protein